MIMLDNRDPEDFASLDARFEQYRLLRQRYPVYKMRVNRFNQSAFLITRFEDVAKLLRDPKLVKEDMFERDLAVLKKEQIALTKYIAEHKNMFRADPPEHLRLKRGSIAAMSARSIASLESTVREKIAVSLRALKDGEVVEFVDSISKEVAAFSICMALGFPSEDVQQIRAFIEELTPLFEGIEHVNDADSVLECLRRLDRYIDKKICDPGSLRSNSLTHALLDETSCKTQLTAGEIRATIRLMIMAGGATSSDLMSSLVYRLSLNSELFVQLKRKPGLVPNTLEEVLRLDSPIQATKYFAREDIRLHRVTIDAGSLVALCIGSANRDPDYWSDPDKIDVSRVTKGLLSFGGGLHMCVGAALARMQGSLMLEELLKCCGPIKLASPRPRLRESWTMRGFDSLHISTNKAT